MKKEIVEYLGFEDNSKNPVGRPKLADKKQYRKNYFPDFFYNM